MSGKIFCTWPLIYKFVKKHVRLSFSFSYFSVNFKIQFPVKTNLLAVFWPAIDEFFSHIFELSSTFHWRLYFTNEPFGMSSNKHLWSNTYVFLRNDEWKKCSYSSFIFTFISRVKYLKQSSRSRDDIKLHFYRRYSTYVPSIYVRVCRTVKIIPEFYGAVFLTHLAIVFLFHCYLQCLKLLAHCYR